MLLLALIPLVILLNIYLSYTAIQESLATTASVVYKNWIVTTIVYISSILISAYLITTLSAFITMGDFAVIFYVCISVVIAFTLCPFLYLAFLNIFYHISVELKTLNKGPNDFKDIKNLIENEKYYMARDRYQKLEARFPTNIELLRLGVTVFEKTNETGDMLKRIRFVCKFSDDEKECHRLLQKVEGIDRDRAEDLKYYLIKLGKLSECK